MRRLSVCLAHPKWLAGVWELVKDDQKSLGKKIATLRKFDAEILGFGLFDEDKIPVEIIALAERRKTARIEKDFASSDKLRQEIIDKGWMIEDLNDNQYKIVKWFRFVILSRCGLKAKNLC